MQRISIVGVGRVGGALAIALSRAGYEIADLVVRRPESADAILPEVNGSAKIKSFGEAVDGEIVIIAVGDPAIAECAEALSKVVAGKPVVLHTSGSLSSDVLSACISIGCDTGSMHPLVSVSDAASGSRSFGGRYFCIEGTEAAVAAANALVASLGGNAFSIETQFKPLYHAAAVSSAGHIVALFSAAVDMLSRCGISAEESRSILLPLLESTVENLKDRKPADALTGSFARLDVSAFERHLKSFEGNISESMQQIFVLLGERSIELVEQAGADENAVARFRRRINMAKRELEC